MDRIPINRDLFDTVKSLEEYRFSTNMFSRKYFEQFIVVFLTSFMNIILQTVDGFVVSRFVGEAALNSVSLLSPFVMIIGATTGGLCGGVTIVLSKTFGLGKRDEIERLYRAIVLLTIGFFIGTTVFQLPLVYYMINYYSVSAELKQLMGQYAIGLIIANSVSVVNSVGGFMLIASGYVKGLFRLSILESVLNALLDVLFVYGCRMGVLGAGLGTAISCTVRGIATVILVQKTFSIFPIKRLDCRSEVRNVLLDGLPSMTTLLLVALSGYFVNAMIARYSGTEAVTVISVCGIGSQLLTKFAGCFMQTGNSQMGLLVGAEDWEVVKPLGEKISIRCLFFVSAAVAVIVLFPQLLFGFYGIREYTDFQVLSVRFYMLRYLPYAVSTCFYQLCVYCGKREVAIISDVTGTILLIPAFLLLNSTAPELVFLCYVLCGIIPAVITFFVFENTITKKIHGAADSKGLHFCFSGGESVAFSQKLNRFLLESGVSSRLAYRLTLLCEEVGAYAGSGKEDGDVRIFLSIRKDKNSVRVFYLDDGAPAILNKKLTATDLILGNYNLIESMASDFLYQNIGGMNNFIIRFDDIHD